MSEVLEITQAPLLFIKTGVVCAEPQGFYEELAAQEAAAIVSPDKVRIELADGGAPSFSGAVTRQSRAIAFDQAAELLADGKNVMYEGFLNTTNTRQQIIDRVAEPAGAQVVMLAMHNRIENIRTNGNLRWNRDRLPLPREFFGTQADLLQIINRMRGSIEFPSHTDNVIHLDGMTTRTILLSRVHAAVQRIRSRVA